MSTQAIKDYLVKQIFIEKNVVTYRSLSRQFGIHVNAAKEELATYHDKAPYDSQTSFATYLLTGEVLNPQRRSRASTQSKHNAKSSDKMDVDDEDEDVGLDMFVPTQTTDAGDENGAEGDDADDEEEDEDYEDVVTICVKIVNETELEEAKDSYHKLTSVHVYSLSPSPIHDASHLCTPTTAIRRTDNTKGEEYAQEVGRVIAPNIHVKPMKPKDLPPAPGPSTTNARVKEEESTSNKTAAAGKSTAPIKATGSIKLEADKKPGTGAVPAAKKTGKLDFFGAARKKEQDKEKEKEKVVKKEEGAEEMKVTKMFFGAGSSTAKAKATVKGKEKEKGKEAEKVVVKSVAVKKEEVEEPVSQPAKSAHRGTKRKSALDFSDSEGEEPVKPRKKGAGASTSRAGTPASSRAPSIAASKPPSTVASSRRSSTALDFDDEEEAEVEQKPAKAKSKVKKGVVLSDDDDDDEEEEEEVVRPVKKGSSRKEERMRKAREIEEREARELMDMDDDHVERVSRRASNRPNPLIGADDDEDEEDEKPAQKKKPIVKDEADDIDVSMDVDSEAPPPEDTDDEMVVPKPKQQKRKREKAPIGSNGLKKRKVMKTRKFKGPDGYMQTEDYSDWESVDGDAEEPEEKKPKTKPRAASKKASTSKENDDEESGGSKAPSRAPSMSKKESKPSAPKASAKESKAKTAAPKAKAPAKSGKGQAGIRSFFNVAQK